MPREQSRAAVCWLGMTAPQVCTDPDILLLDSEQRMNFVNTLLTFFSRHYENRKKSGYISK